MLQSSSAAAAAPVDLHSARPAITTAGPKSLKLPRCFVHLEAVMPAVQEAASPITHLVSRWQSARAATDSLFEIVRPQCWYERPIAERHRIVFYIGHLEAFDANLLRPALRLGS